MNYQSKDLSKAKTHTKLHSFAYQAVNDDYDEILKDATRVTSPIKIKCSDFKPKSNANSGQSSPNRKHITPRENNEQLSPNKKDILKSPTPDFAPTVDQASTYRDSRSKGRAQQTIS